MLVSYSGERLDLATTLTATKIPPTGRRLGQRVEHIVVIENGWLSDIVSEAIGLPKAFILELIRFGAIHYCPISPPPRPDSDPKYAEQIELLRQAGIQKFGRDPALHTPKRILDDVELTFPGGYIRVHVHPKRFPAAYTVDWSKRIVAVTEEYVVVNKPAGLQVPSTVDNVLESVQACVEQALDLEQNALKCTHRLDGGTEGLVVLGRTTDFARYFMNMLANKAQCIRKIYRALAVAAPPVGEHIHYLKVDQRGPGDSPHSQVVDAETEGAKIAILEVLEVEWVGLTGDAKDSWGSHAYEVTILLKTGRTHQIRAQLAALGCPLLGEALYVHPSVSKAAQTPAASSDALTGTNIQVAADPASVQTSSSPSETANGSSVAVKDSSLHASPAVLDVGLLSEPGHLLRDTVSHEACSLAAARMSGDPAGLVESAAVVVKDELQNGRMQNRDVACAVHAAHTSATAHVQTAGANHIISPGGGADGDAQLATGAALESNQSFGAMLGIGHVAPEHLLKPFGLQAYKLEVLDEDSPFGKPPVVFEAGTPWWRS